MSNVRRVGVVNTIGPLCQGLADQAGSALAGPAAGGIGRATAVDERPGIGRITDDFVNGGGRGWLPEHLTVLQAADLAPGQEQTLLFAIAQHLVARAQFLEFRQHERDHLADLGIGIFLDAPIGQPD